MNLRCLSPHFDPTSFIIPRRVPASNRHDLRNRRRRRFPSIRCQFGIDFFLNLLNSVQPLDLLAPVAGFASAAAAVYVRRSLRPLDYRDTIGEWILFTSPTPFNRSVLLRCPSVSFEGGEDLMNSINDRLVREDRHYINLSQGRCLLKSDGAAAVDNDIKFQRVCVRTDDDGVISMDWPDYLDLEREHGLDTTVLIIPGTPEGSMDKTVKLFVHDLVKHGCFPIVMNPRGCAGSALTTPRLFSPADSDDVSTAVQFVNEIRPWTTLMGIGLGYGANMLTKYLAEAGETTPVTAAVCIDTPFDLEESTKSSSHQAALNEKLTSGLREILRVNKELFQGKTKGFDVAKALSATSIRDFDRSISMISFGFDSLESFYRETCTRKLIGNLKIPSLFIQTDDGTVPLVSVPRNSITDNPFTSLLLCSCSHLAINRIDLSVGLWNQQLAIEWLSAVEHALLKGRHPLLNDVDITIKPSDKLALNSVETVSEKTKAQRRYDASQLLSRNSQGNVHSFLRATGADTVNGFLVYPYNMAAGDTDFDNVIGCTSGSKFDEMQRDEEHVAEIRKTEKHGTDKDTQTEVVGIEGVKNVMSSGESQVTQTATVIMNMLDATMPGTLDDDHKKKVLIAMEQGETFMKALQEAVPEDVRGRITSSVTEIMESQSTNLNFEAVKQIGWIPNLTSDTKSNDQEKMKGSPSKELGSDDAILEQEKVGNSFGDISEGNTGCFQENDAQSSGSVEVKSDMEDNTNQSFKPEGDETTEDKGELFDVTGNSDEFDVKCDRNQAHRDEGSTADDSEVVDTLLNPSTSAVSTDSVGEGDKTTVEISTQDGTSQNAEGTAPQLLSSKPHSVNVSEALNALTEFDNSTHMAVNNVYGVIENMIDHLERSEKDVGEIKEVEDQRFMKGFDGSPVINGENSHNLTCSDSGSGIEQNLSQSASQPEMLFNGGSVESYEDTNDNMLFKKTKHNPPSSSAKWNKLLESEVFKPSPLRSTNLSKYGDTMDIIPDVAMKRYWLSPYAPYLNRYFTQFPNLNSLDLVKATDLILDPEEGQWKMIDQPSSSIIGTRQYGNVQNVNFASKWRHAEFAVDQSYVIPDGDHSECDDEAFREEDGVMKEKIFFLIKSTLLDDLKVEAGRRLNVSDSKEFDSLLSDDLECFTEKVSQSVVSSGDFNLFNRHYGSKSARFGTIEGQKTVEAILSALQNAIHLREVLPLGVIVGITLASLRTYFQVVTLHDGTKKAINRPVDVLQSSHGHKNYIDKKHSKVEKMEKNDDHHFDSNKSTRQGHEETATVGSANGGIMAGAMTAALGASALGASALLANHQKKMDENFVTEEFFSKKTEENKNLLTDYETMQEKNQNSLVSSIAEKAMSVAGPVMPTKGDGKVDQERLVAILAELGQKGGILRLVGKFALLWGGIRGAMSLTDRLISYLHISKRPLIQRLLGFIFMVLVLWSPVVIPLLPTLLQSWTTKTPNRIVEFACIVGLYIASTVLIVLWGKRIHGYANPIEQYGLDLTSIPMVFDYLKGLAGGIMIVFCIHLANVILGYATISCTWELPSSQPRVIVLLKAYGSILLLTLQGILSATGIAIVEELLFRSWLAKEVSVDLGFYHAIMISGLFFALIQWSLPSVPGYLLLSLFLFGIKQRSQGRLAAPVGIRTGLMAASFVEQHANLLSYRADTPFWIASARHWHPLDGVVGISLCALLAIFFFPKPPQRPIRD